jgi:hypothetical protein
MTTLVIAPALKMGKNGVLGLLSGTIMRSIDQFRFESHPELSMGALS